MSRVTEVMEDHVELTSAGEEKEEATQLNGSGAAIATISERLVEATSTAVSADAKISVSSKTLMATKQNNM